MEFDFQWLLIGLPIAFALLYGIAWLSFRYFESPILKLKRHFAYDRESKPGASPLREEVREGMPALGASGERV